MAPALRRFGRIPMARLGAKKNGPAQIALGIGIVALMAAGLFLAFSPGSAPPTPPEPGTNPTFDATPITSSAETQATSLLDPNGTPISPEVAALQTPLPEATPTPTATSALASTPSPTSASPQSSAVTASPQVQPTGEVPRVEGTNGPTSTPEAESGITPSPTPVGF